MSGKVVVGVDGSPHSSAALSWALTHAERLGDTEVVALFAWELPLIGVPGAFDRAEMELRAKAFLADVLQTVAPAPPVPLQRLVAHGEPTAALVTAARDADLLVLGTRGRTAFRGLLLGSVSQGCAAAANCPVVIVKVPAAAGREGVAGATEADADA